MHHTRSLVGPRQRCSKAIAALDRGVNYLCAGPRELAFLVEPATGILREMVAHGAWESAKNAYGLRIVRPASCADPKRLDGCTHNTRLLAHDWPPMARPHP